MDFFIDNLWVLWLSVAAVMLLIEVSTEALVSIWFVIGAVIAAVLSIFVDDFAIQVAVFVVCSAVLLFTLHDVSKKKIQSGQPKDTPKYSMLGKKAVAAEDITQHSGKVLVGDVYWRAVCESGKAIRKDAAVTVVGEDGTTLTVREDI